MPSSPSFPNALAANDDFEFSALHEAKNYRQALLKSFACHIRGAVLEVGAGIGQITQEIKGRAGVTDLVAIEPDAKFHAGLGAILPEANIVRGTVHQAPRKKWDCIISINVLEHIQADAEELAFYRELLRESGGALCLFVPAREEIYAPLDKDFGHFRRYTKAGLHEKLTRAGFEIVDLRYFNLVGYFAWWLSFCVLKQGGFKVNAVRLYDRVVFPVVYWLESRICPPPFGQSLLVIARPKVGV